MFCPFYTLTSVYCKRWLIFKYRPTANLIPYPYTVTLNVYVNVKLNLIKFFKNSHPTDDCYKIYALE